jgi:hypothetical protein
VDSDGGDVGDREGGAELVGADVGEADVADEAVLAHSRERLDDLLERRVGHSRRVQVVEVDVVQAEPARAHVRRLPQVVPVPDGAHVGVFRAAADEPALGGDDQLFWIPTAIHHVELKPRGSVRRRGSGRRWYQRRPAARDGFPPVFTVRCCVRDMKFSSFGAESSR